MSPEYAVHGHFSTKSDVFSYGVILLETVSGRKNTSTFEYLNNSLSLIGYVSNHKIPNVGVFSISYILQYDLILKIAIMMNM